MKIHSSSFRDPAGFVFQSEDRILRQVNQAGRDDYDHFMRSGLYESLVKDGLLIQHEESNSDAFDSTSAYRVIEPERIPFITYPYEWCFEQLRDAALLTLELEIRALKYGMGLKDASGYNIQFLGSRPVFIDTLSFERTGSGKPWRAYGQFCRHFLAPVALEAMTGPAMANLFRSCMDGIPLDQAVRLLPFSARFKPGLALHLFLHEKNLRKQKDITLAHNEQAHINLRAILEHLKETVQTIRQRFDDSHWVNYENNDVADDYRMEKRAILSDLLERISPDSVWDLGSNTGDYSHQVSTRSRFVAAMDSDPACVQNLYLRSREKGKQNIVPLVMDLGNPSPSLGWDHQERMSLKERGPADCVLALALIHHLRIKQNIPLRMSADFFADIARYLIIEFVPLEDPKAMVMTASLDRKFEDYNVKEFERVFAAKFEILVTAEISITRRRIYLMKNRGSI